MKKKIIIGVIVLIVLLNAFNLYMVFFKKENKSVEKEDDIVEKEESEYVPHVNADVKAINAVVLSGKETTDFESNYLYHFVNNFIDKNSKIYDQDDKDKKPLSEKDKKWCKEHVEESTEVELRCFSGISEEEFKKLGDDAKIFDKSLGGRAGFVTYDATNIVKEIKENYSKYSNIFDKSFEVYGCSGMDGSFCTSLVYSANLNKFFEKSSDGTVFGKERNIISSKDKNDTYEVTYIEYEIKDDDDHVIIDEKGKIIFKWNSETFDKDLKDHLDSFTKHTAIFTKVSNGFKYKETIEVKEEKPVSSDNPYIDIAMKEECLFGCGTGPYSEDEITENSVKTFDLNNKKVEVTFTPDGELFVNNNKVNLGTKIYGTISMSSVHIIEATKEDNTKDYYLFVVHAKEESPTIYIADMDGKIVNKIENASNPIVKHKKDGKAYILYWEGICIDTDANLFDKYYFAIGDSKVYKEINDIDYDGPSKDGGKTTANTIWWSSVCW